MPDTTSPILAVGAAGKFAGLVVPALVQRGARVRGFVKNDAEAQVARAHGAAEVVIGDLTDQASTHAALKGVKSVFYIAPAFLPDEAKVGIGMVAAAKQAGVRRFVFSSVIHPILTELQNHAAKGPVEEAVLNSGMEFTFLHPAMFFQNYAASWPEILKTSTLAEPWSDQTRFSRVDYRDVAEVAAIALTEDRLRFGTFELSSEGSLNRRDVAALLADVLGRPIEAIRPNLDEQTNGASDPSKAEQMAAMKRMFDWYDKHALLGNALTLRAILRREPRTLRAYLQELASGPDGQLPPKPR